MLSPIKHSCISIHALCEEGDFLGRVGPRHRSDFYPRPLRGGRPGGGYLMSCVAEFLSTPSARRATGRIARESSSTVFLSTPSARRATLRFPVHRFPCSISIHALCEEGDSYALPDRCMRSYFYPRPLRGGRRCRPVAPRRRKMISIHALCEEGD